MGRKALLRLAVAGGAAAAVVIGATGAANADTATGTTTAQHGGKTIVTCTTTHGRLPGPIVVSSGGGSGKAIAVKIGKPVTVKGGKPVTIKGGGGVLCVGNGAGQCTVRVVKGGGTLVTCTVGRHPVPLPIRPGGPVIKSGGSSSSASTR